MMAVISSFFDRLSPSVAHCAWNNFIKLPTAKKAALVVVSFFALYKLYLSFKPLTNRVNKPEEKKSSGLDQDTQEPLSLLGLFKAQFPGDHITIKHQNSEMTLDTHLMKTIFRIEEVSSCAFDPPTCTFTLSYKAPKTVVLKKIPQVILDKMSSLKERFAVLALLKTEPTVRISKKIKVQFIPTDDGKKIILVRKAVSLKPDKLGYTARLKSILVPREAEKELYIEVEHDSTEMCKNIGSQLLVEAIDLNFSKSPV